MGDEVRLELEMLLESEIINLKTHSDHSKCGI